MIYFHLFYLFIYAFILNNSFILFYKIISFKIYLHNYYKKKNLQKKKNSFIFLSPPTHVSPINPDKPPHHRSSSDQAIPATSPDGKSITTLLSSWPDHLRP